MTDRAYSGGRPPYPGGPATPQAAAPWQQVWWTDARQDPWRDPGAPAVVIHRQAEPITPSLEPVAAEEPVAPVGGRRGLGLVFVVAVVSALLAGALGGALGYVAATSRDRQVLGGGDGRVPGLAQRPPESVAGVVQQVLPSVVTVKIEAGGKKGNGSGFIASPDGYVVTNEHVAAAGAGGTITIAFTDGTSAPAEVVGSDPASDLAVLRVRRTGLAPVRFGDSDKLAVGDPVIAFGAPLGLQNTVTTGIVSALDRVVVTGDEESADPSVLAAVQTDAAINPGNSGGPLVDGAGRVIGVNSAIATLKTSDGKGGNIGLGFAIPINQAKRVAEDIIATGKARRTVFGAKIDEAYRSPEGGARLREVEPGGPAARAGMRNGDVVLRFAGRTLSQSIDLVALVRKHAPDTVVPVEYSRDGARHTASVTLAASNT